MKTIKITKMQGCGNDFIIIDYSEYEKTGLSMSELAKKVCNRNFGAGADGMIIPAYDASEETDIAWYFYNSDGSSAQMCGNGMRCFAKYVYDRKLLNKRSFSVNTLAGIIRPEVQEDGNVKVNMGTPIFEEEKIPFIGERVISINDRVFDITPVSMGNPHCVIFTEEDPLYLAKTYGPELETHPYFPEKTNTEFVKLVGRNEIEMRVFERGCGITLACGTGACASVAACILNNLTESYVQVNLQGGTVYVEWKGSKEEPDKDIFLIGPANYIFTGDYML